MSSTSDFFYARHGSCGRDIRSNKLTCIIKIDMRWFLRSSDESEMRKRPDKRGPVGAHLRSNSDSHDSQRDRSIDVNIRKPGPTRNTRSGMVSTVAVQPLGRGEARGRSAPSDERRHMY